MPVIHKLSRGKAMLVPVNRLGQQSVVRYLAPVISSYRLQTRQATAEQPQGNIVSTARLLSTTLSRMSSSKFSLASKYKGLEKNVW